MSYPVEKWKKEVENSAKYRSDEELQDQLYVIPLMIKRLKITHPKSIMIGFREFHLKVIKAEIEKRKKDNEHTQPA